MNPAHRSVFCLLVASLFTCLSAGLPAIAQTPPVVDPDQPGYDPAALGLDVDPFVSEPLGITMYLPQGTQVVPIQTTAAISVVLRDPNEPPAWQMQIQRMIMRNLPDPTPAGVAGQILKTAQRSDPTLIVHENEPIPLGTRRGHMLVLETHDQLGGYVVGDLEKETYIVIRFNSLREEYERLRDTLHASFRSLRLHTADELRAEREKQEALAHEAIRLLTPEALQAAISGETWYRVYRPDPGGDPGKDHEIGYFRMSMTEGRRGQVTPEKDPENYLGKEKELGLFVRMDAHYLEATDPLTTADLQALMWVKWDRSEEQWQVRVTRRQGEASKTEAETGVRVQDPGRWSLRVLRASLNDMHRWIILPSSPYLSQAEIYALGHLLPRDGSITGTMAFQSYDNSAWDADTLPIRLDEWRPSTDGSGTWRLISRVSPDTPAVTSIFDRHGKLVRRIKADGTLTEPIDRTQLRDLWKRKGLPTN